jgi:hypothetical protein
MPVRGLPLQLIIPKRRILKTMGDWYKFCFYNNLDNDLKAGRAITYGPVGGKAISVAEGHQIIRACAGTSTHFSWNMSRSLSTHARKTLKPGFKKKVRYRCFEGRRITQL